MAFPVSSIAITYLALAFLYKVIPNAQVRLRSALLGAFVAGSAWEVAKFLFAWGSGRMMQVMSFMLRLRVGAERYPLSAIR